MSAELSFYGIFSEKFGVLGKNSGVLGNDWAIKNAHIWVFGQIGQIGLNIFAGCTLLNKYQSF